MNLKPYEDEQIPAIMNPNRKYIERIPMIVDPSTGQILPKFQKFYKDIVTAIITYDMELLYSISDKSTDILQFKSLYDTKIGNKLNKLVLYTPDTMFKIDIELNIQRFKGGCRNILGSFLINTYEISQSSFEIVDFSDRNIKIGCAEIYFTYRHEEFQLISAFTPYIVSDITN